jgi:hypothetical protein
MTAPDASVDPVREWRELLTPAARAAVHMTPAVPIVHQAIDAGWTVAQLAAECNRDHHGAINLGGLVLHRLRECADTPPPAASTPVERPDHCGRCDRTTRHLLDVNRLPGPARCPDCHPLARKAAR